MPLYDEAEEELKAEAFDLLLKLQARVDPTQLPTRFRKKLERWVASAKNFRSRQKKEQARYHRDAYPHLW